MARSIIKILMRLNSSPFVEEESYDFIEDEPSIQYEQNDLDFLFQFFSNRFDVSLLEKSARDLFELSVNAFDAVVHAWMSEQQIEPEIVSFGRRVIAAAEKCDAQEGRLTAEKAACDRTKADTITVMNAAYKAQHEAHRMMGLLRFSQDTDGVYVAKSAPDNLILPALGEYFTARFGETAWKIIDEKRGIILSRENGKKTKIFIEKESAVSTSTDEWEDLWRHYHKTINNESRYNPNLQRQFMPRRYWKYLPEKS